MSLVSRSRTILALCLALNLGQAWALEKAKTCKPPVPASCAAQKEASTKPPKADENAPELSPLRAAILKTAAEEIGKVSVDQGEDCNKQGWDRLVAYHDTAEGDGKFDRNVLKTAQNHGKTKDHDWCGIFATWAVISGAQQMKGTTTGNGCRDVAVATGLEQTAAADRALGLRWNIGVGPVGIPFQGGTKGMKPGDIVNFKDTEPAGYKDAVAKSKSNPGGMTEAEKKIAEWHPLIHFAVVESVQGDQVYTIDGNSDCQMVLRKKRKLDDVAGFYSVD